MSSTTRDRFSWIVPTAFAAVAVLGCSRGPAAETTRNAVVATAAGQSLQGRTLEHWLLMSPNRPSPTIASTLVSNWIDVTLLATAMRDGTVLDDSATIDAAITPDAARGMSLKFWQARAAARPPITDHQGDSLVTVDRVRVFQHLVLLLPPNADSATMQNVARRAQDLRQRAQQGEDFSALVRKYSEDTAGRASGGFLPAIPKSGFPPTIAGAVWSLHPGDVSDLIHAPGRVEILRRATPDQARPYLKQWLGPQLARRADSLFIDSLAAARHLTVPEAALARVRAMAREPVALDGGGPMATWDGGSLTPAETRMWLMMIAPTERAAMTAASDSASRAFLHQLGERELVVQLAAPKGAITPEARAALVPQYKAALAGMEADLRHAGGALEPGALATSYIDSLLAGTIRFHVLPGALASVLRSRDSTSVNQSALSAVIDLAYAGWSVNHANDTIPRR